MELSLKKISLTKLMRIGIGALAGVMITACGGGGGRRVRLLAQDGKHRDTFCCSRTIHSDCLFNGATATTSISASGVTLHRPL